MAEAPDLWEIAHDGFQHVFNPVSARHDFLDGISDLQMPWELEVARDAFAKNLKGVVRVVSIPWAIRWWSLRKETLVAINSDLRASQPIASKADLAAATEQRYDELMKRAAFQKIFVTQLLDELMLNRESADDVAKPLADLLRQGAVMTWTAAEVAAQDVFRTLMNAFPEKLGPLLGDASFKKLFAGAAKLDWEALAAYRFDVSRSVGDVLLSSQPVDSPTRFKTVFNSLFPADPPLRASMEADDLRLLFYQRNLIVHRAGLFDQQYVDETGDAVTLKTELEITPQRLEEYLRSVSAFGKAVLIAARECFGVSAPGGAATTPSRV